MSENPIPENADFRQLRTQAKELLKELRAADPAAKLAQAQFEIARRHGHASWPRLVEAVEVPRLVERMRRLVERGDADALDRLLTRRPTLRKRLGDPLFGFDAPALVHAAGGRHARALLPVLVRHGADPNARTMWWAGGFSALDLAKEDVVDLLLSLGARWDAGSAAAHGRLDVLCALLDEDPSRVSARGGDGKTPLHCAKTPEVAALLIERGADLEARDVDHESTPLQYQATNAPVARVLLERGAAPDVLAAAALDDVDRLERVLRDDPEAALARVGEGAFVTVKSNGGHIYDYVLGRGKSPQLVAAERGSLRVLARLEGLVPARDLVAAAWLGDEAGTRRLFHAKPPIAPEDHAAVAQAAVAGRVETVRLLLECGFDPLAPGMDSGTALHVAAWFGWPEVVRLLVARVPLDLGDLHHGSPPLGWATHGAQWCRNAQGDYPAVVRLLLDAGADPRAPANSEGTSMLDQAGDREDVKAILRERMAPRTPLPSGGEGQG